MTRTMTMSGLASNAMSVRACAVRNESLEIGVMQELRPSGYTSTTLRSSKSAMPSWHFIRGSSRSTQMEIGGKGVTGRSWQSRRSACSVASFVFLWPVTLCKKEKSFQVGPGQRRSDPTFCPLICKISDLDSQIPSPFRSAPVG